MENTSIDCAKIHNNSNWTKTSRNEVMQPKTSNNYSQPIFPRLFHNQAGFDKLVINRRDLIYLDISKMVFTLKKLEKLVFDYSCIILGS